MTTVGCSSSSDRGSVPCLSGSEHHGYQPEGKSMSKYDVCIEGVSVEAVFNKLGGVEGARRFLRNELTVSERSWREQAGVIYFSVTPDGTAGKDWTSRLEVKGFHVRPSAKRMLQSPDFKPTSSRTIEVAVIKGSLFLDNNRTAENIQAYARAMMTPDNRKLRKPGRDLACLIREKFTDEEIETMRLWHILAMHVPMGDSDGGPIRFDVSRGSDGWRRCFSAYSLRPEDCYGPSSGFAFEVVPK